MTWTLIQKDVRMLRPIFIMAAAVALFFYGLVPVGWCVANHFSPDPVDTRRAVIELLKAGNMCVWFGLYLLYAAVGGTAFAGDRHARWADLVAMLPVSRLRIIAVKLAVSATICLALAAVNGVVLFGVILADEARDLFAAALRVMIRPYGMPVVGVVLIVGVSVELFLRRSDWWVRLSAGVTAVLLLLLAGVTGAIHLMSLRSYGRGLHWPSWEMLASVAGLVGVYVAFAVAFFGFAWLMSSMLRSPALSTAIAIGLIVAMFATWTNYANGQMFASSFEPVDPALRRLMLELLAAAGVMSVAAGAVVQRYRGTP